MNNNTYFVLFCLVNITISNNFLCIPCQNSVKAVDYVVRHLLPNKFAAEFVQILCMRQFDSKDLCDKVGQQIAPIAISSVINNYINPKHICSSFCSHSYHKYNSTFQSQRIIHEGIQKISQVDLDFYMKKQKVIRNFNSENINILHLSDIHLDPHYAQKSSTQCSYPICCHPEHGYPQNPSAQASHFGSKNCDTPQALLNSLMDSVQKYQQAIDIVIMTGDFSAHNQWQKTNESISDNNRKIYEKIKNNKKTQNSIIVTSEGNNDFTPDHQYNPTNTKLLSLTIIQNQKNKLQNLTIISLNTIAYDNYNLYLLGDQSFAIFQLMLLQRQLQANSNIYLCGHIPPTLQQTAPQYSKVFRALVSKYRNKIINQFYGHTHLDQLTINTSPQDISQITNFAFIAPSVTPLGGGKSRYRVYNVSIDSENSGVIGYDQYMIKSLNSTIGEWVLDYNFRDKYKIQGQLPVSKQQIKIIVNKIMNGNGQHRQKYLRMTGTTEIRSINNVHCLIFDDFEYRNRCQNGYGVNFSSKLFSLIDLLRGNWGYYQLA